MKYLFFTGFALSVLFGSHRAHGRNLSGNPGDQPDAVNGGIIKIMTSPELNNLTADWMREYKNLNPGVTFSVSTIGKKGNDSSGTICFLSTDSIPSSSQWRISIGHQVIVPVLNARNPMYEEIVREGISAADFASLFTGPVKMNWSDLIKGGHDKPVNQFVMDVPAIITAVSDFIQIEPAVLNAYLISGTAGFASAIQKDPYAIGFCRLSDVEKELPGGPGEKIKLLPIDKNGNGRMDNFENIYNSPADLSRGVWIGKYPHALAGNIYAMSGAKPADQNTIAFLSWITTEGGKYLVSNGYGDLISMEKQANLAALSNNPEIEAAAGSAASLPWLFIAALTFVAVLIVMVLARIFTRSESIPMEDVLKPLPVMNESSGHSPKGLYYDRTHTWAFMESDGLVRLGIDDFLGRVTGTITRITMKEPGELIRRGEKIITLTKFGKQLSLYSPISGIIKAHNTSLHENSSLVNNHPYAEGWVYRIEPKNWLREQEFMLMGEKHTEWLKDELTRLRKFFDDTFKVQLADRDYLVLQDGGELRANLLADLGPEVWEEFQRKFIDPSR
jgi:glycine cleavage system H lipoate-binding protein/ABC-type phosphate transport system substrate-binding protein